MRFIVLFTLTIFIFGSLTAENELFLNHGMSEMTLANGMKVILKQIPDEEEEVQIHLIAPGGWAGLSKKEKTNARIATEVLWESGFGGHTSDTIHALMWLNSVELISEIKPFSRVIDGSASSEGVEMLFKLINSMIASPNFTEQGMEEAKKNMSALLQLLPYDSSHTFDYFSKALNTAHYKGFRQLNLNSLKRKTDIETLKKVYQRCFGNPGDFKVYIAGHFDLEEMKVYIKKYFESIPAKNYGSIEMSTVENGVPLFPQGIARLEMPTYQLGLDEALIRMTFPIRGKVDKALFKKIFLLSKLIDRRLNNEFETTGVIGEGYCFCQYSFPFYPYLNETWLTIQSRLGSKGTCKDPLFVEQAIIAILYDLKKNGPSEEEFLFLNQLIKDRELNFSENEDLLKLFLTSDEMVGVIFKEMARTDVRKNSIVDVEEACIAISELIDLNNYTIIFSKR